MELIRDKYKVDLVFDNAVAIQTTPGAFQNAKIKNGFYTISGSYKTLITVDSIHVNHRKSDTAIFQFEDSKKAKAAHVMIRAALGAFYRKCSDISTYEELKEQCKELGFIPTFQLENRAIQLIVVGKDKPGFEEFYSRLDTNAICQDIYNMIFGPFERWL